MGSGTAHARCAAGADASTCIAGTVAAQGFTIASTGAVARLFRTLPMGAQFGSPDLTETVAADGTWSFDTSLLDGGAPWSHYYAQLIVQFGVTSTVSRVVGPLSAPSTGAPVAVTVLPVRLAVVQARSAEAGVMQVESASARVFDPSTGLELTDGAGAVTFTAGAASVALPWTGSAYAANLSPTLDGQAAYTFTITHPALGASPTTWHLAAAVAPFDGTITSPPAVAHVGPDPLTVAWQPDPAADYVEVTVFGMGANGCGGSGDAGSPAADAGDASSVVTPTACYASPAPESPTVTTETVPAADLKTAPYLVNVAFSNALCPPTSDGCVYAGNVAAESVSVVVGDGGS